MSTNTVVFIHGNFVSRHSWQPWINRFEAKGHRCHAIAYPGRDASPEELRRNPDAGLLGRLTLSEVIDHHVQEIRAQPEAPIIIGHSFGGLLTQLMLQRGLGAAAVAIDSVPPQGVITTSWSFIRSVWPAITPFVSTSKPYYMPFRHFQYAFANDLPLDEQKVAYDVIVPESRRLARGGLSSAARIDFRRPHPPLLMIAGGKDNIMPASLNRANYKRYSKSKSVVDFKEFPSKAHYSVIGGPGWEDVADYALDWARAVVAD